ncbi:hypothetical protein EBZ39_07705 [bacterium]|nr:hypothetical protein [bacterium]
MKQVWPNYSYSPATNVLTLTGLNIDRDQLLLVTAADRGRIMYNFADSSVTASAFTSGANTALTLVATTAGLTTTAALVIYYDDQLASNSVTVSSLPSISGTVTANLGGGVVVTENNIGYPASKLVAGVYDIYGSQFGNNNPFPISGVIRNNGINNDPWVYIPRLTMYHPDLENFVFDGYYRFDGVNTWGNNNFNYGNVPYLTRALESDTYIFRLMVHDESNDVEIEFASQSSASPDFPTVMASTNATLVAGSLTFNTEQRESYGVRVTNSVTIGNSVTASISGTVTIGSALPAGTNRIGVVTIGAGTVTIAAGTAQIGSVTASISGTVPVSGTFWQATQPVSLASTTVTVSSLPALAAGTAQIGSVTASISGTVPVSGTFYQATQPVSLATVPTHGVTLASTTVTVSSLPALSAGTAQIGSVTASISGTVPVSISSVTVGNSVTIGSIPAISGTVTANTFAVQGTAVTTSNFTSTTASTVLANNNATRRVLTIFNEGAGNLHICPGATCTTVAYQVRLSSGDYYEVPNHQTTVTHSAVFATAGTARVTEVY